MTGFGKAECELATRKISVEIKSLNSKTLDIYTKIPGIYRQKELEIRNELSKSLQRGKIEFILFYEYTDDSKATTINSGVVRNYIHQLKSISDELSINSQEQLLQIAMRLPDTLNIEREEIDEADWEKIQGTIKQAIEQLDNFRIQEGKHLLDDFISRIEIIEKYKNEITPFELARTVKIKEK